MSIEAQPRWTSASTSGLTSGFYKPPNRNPLLLHYLPRNRLRDIIYGGFLFNHEAHGIVVFGCSDLDESATEEKMKLWEDCYFKKLEPPREITSDMPYITDENWTSFFCDPRTNFNFHYPVYLRFFDAKVHTLGRDGALARYFPAVSAGLAACAIHPVIHLGFGMDAGDDGMVAEGLALMCSNFHVLGSGTAVWSPLGLGILDCSEVFMRQAAVNNYHKVAVEASRTISYKAINVGTFQRKMLSFDDPSVPLGSALDSMAPLRLPAIGDSLFSAIKEATALAAAAYLASDCEFFIIHGLTSLHASLVVIANLEANPDVQRWTLTHWWRTMMATVVCLNIPGFDSKVTSAIEIWRRCELKEEVNQYTPAVAHGREDRPDVDYEAFWKQALDIALASEDEHAAKAVYVLWRWSLWGLPRHSMNLFREAAANQIRHHPKGGSHKNIWFAVDDA